MNIHDAGIRVWSDQLCSAAILENTYIFNVTEFIKYSGVAVKSTHLTRE